MPDLRSGHEYHFVEDGIAKVVRCWPRLGYSLHAQGHAEPVSLEAAQILVDRRDAVEITLDPTAGPPAFLLPTRGLNG